MVEGDHLERVGRCVGEDARHVLELGVAEGATLLLPRSHRVQPDDCEPLGPVDGLELRPDAQELVEGAREPPRRPARDVVVPRNDEQRAAERLQKAGGALVFFGFVAVRQVAARHDEFGVGLLYECPQIAFDLGLFPRACVQIRHLEHAQERHQSGRL